MIRTVANCGSAADNNDHCDVLKDYDTGNSDEVKKNYNQIITLIIPVLNFSSPGAVAVIIFIFFRIVIIIILVINFYPLHLSDFHK